MTYLKEAGLGRGCRARRRPAGLHTIARLRRGPKVRPRGGRTAPLPDPVPPRSARRLHGVPSAIAGSPQSPLFAQSPRSPQSPPQRTHPAPSPSRRAPRSPRPAAARLRIPGVRYPENAGRPPAHPAALSPGSAAAARRRRRSRASAEGERPPPPLGAPRIAASGRGRESGKARGQGRQVSRGGRRPARPTDSSPSGQQRPPVPAQRRPRVPAAGTLGDPEGVLWQGRNHRSRSLRGPGTLERTRAADV